MSKNEKLFSLIYFIEYFLWLMKKITNDKFTFVSTLKYLEKHQSDQSLN